MEGKKLIWNFDAKDLNTSLKLSNIFVLECTIDNVHILLCPLTVVEYTLQEESYYYNGEPPAHRNSSGDHHSFLGHTRKRRGCYCTFTVPLSLLLSQLGSLPSLLSAAFAVGISKNTRVYEVSLPCSGIHIFSVAKGFFITML